MTENGTAAHTTPVRAIMAIWAGSAAGALAATAVEELFIASGLRPQPPELGPINWPVAAVAVFVPLLVIFLAAASLFGGPIWWVLHRLGYRRTEYAALVGSILALFIAALFQVWLVTHQEIVLDRAGRLLASSSALTWAGAGIALQRSLFAPVFGALAGFVTFKVGYTKPGRHTRAR